MASGPLTVKIQIDADGSAAIVGLNKVKGALDATGQQAKDASGGIKALSSSFQSLALTAGAALSVGALAASFTAANRQAGLLRASLETVTGSVAKATTAWEVLQGFAAQTPYSLEQAVQGFIKLKSMGLDPSIAALTSYGNTAGAMGKSLNQMVEAVADAATGEFERLKEFGIKAKQNGDQVSMTFQGVTTTIGNNAQAIEQYLLDIGNVQFAGGMERQAKTLGGTLSNLGDAWDQFWVKLGDTGLTQGVITVLNDVSSGIASLGDGITGANGVSSTFGSTMASLGAVVATTYGELKTGVWSDTTTAIVATAGAIGGAIGLMTALGAAVGIATGVWGAFTAILLANPITLAVAGIGALIGVLYTLQDQTVQVGDTTTTVGATVEAVWGITASYSQAAWATFASYVSGEFNRLPPAVSGAGSAILSVWSAVMTNLQSIASGAINYVANLFSWLGRSAGILAGEVAMSFESGFSFDRLKEGLSGAVEYTDRLGAATNQAAAEIAAAGQEIAKKAENIRAVNQVESDYAELERELAAANAKTALAAKLHALEQANLNGHIKRGTEEAKDGANATDAGGKAHGGAAKAVKAHATEIDALIKRVMPARDDTEQLANATAILADKMAKGELSAGEFAAAIDKLEDELLRSTKANQDLIDEYDREGAQARKLAEDSDRLQAIIAKGGEQAERAKVALENLGKQQAKNGQEAAAWSEVWKNAVKRIDDTFANLWQDLFSGAKSTLDSLKRAITSWLAEVAHALITKPLVVAITAGMTGGAGTAGATGTVANAASGAGGFGNLLSMGSSLWSGVTSLFSAATYTGLMDGFMAATSIMSSSGILGGASSVAALSSGAASTGSMAFAIGAAAPYLIAALPIAAIAYGIFAKYQKDQKPRYGAYAATTHGGTGQFEDSVGVPGAFGLTFGMNDKGSANIDAEEARAVFEGFAKMSEALAQFYGGDVAAEVEATLKQISNEHYARTGILNYAMDVNEAFDVAFTQIIDAAAATGDSVAVVMKAVVGDLSGTAENMAKQIETAMQTTTAVIAVAKALEGTDAGKILELGDDLTANALKLVDYARHAQGAGETIAQALARMSLNLTGLSTALDLSGQTVAATGTAFIDLARDLAATADAAGVGMAGLMQLQAVYFDQFFSDTAKFTRNIEAASKAITAGFKSLNLAVDLSVMKDRQAFIDLVNSIDLTTEAGRKFYVELMKLAPAFDAVFDGVEAFMDWLRPQDKAARAFDDLTDLFDKWGITMPKTREEFDKLVASGILTAEQMAILGGRLDALNLVFSELSQRASLLDFAEVLSPTNGASPDRIKAGEDAFRKAGYKGDLRDPKGMADFVRTIAALPDAGGEAVKELLKYVDTFDQFFDAIAAAAQQHSDLQLRLAEAQGDNALALRLRREQELKDALDDTNRALLKRIYALEDAKAAMNAAYAALERAVAAERQQVEEAYQARVDAINAEREAINAAHEERIAAINAEREALQTQISAAQEALSKIEGILGSVQSALDTIRGQLAVSDIALAAARRQLANWARQGVLPDQEAFDRVMGTLNRDDKGNYASANAYRSNQQATYANLLELERLGLAQKTAAEKQLEALEAQTAALDAQITQADQISQDQLDALDEQLKQADAWRADELERLDLILEDAKKAMEITLGIYEEVIAIDDALKALNKAMADYLALRDLGKSQALDPNLGDAANDPMGSASVAQQAGFDDLRAEIIELRNVIATVGTAQITPLKSIDDRLRKFDTDGLPPGRDDVVLLRAA
jgi:hypothetical protein